MRLNTFSKAGKLRKAFSLVLISIILVTCLGGAVFSVPLNVLALPPALLKIRTIGELIITILAGANTAIVNPSITAPIYSNLNITYEDLINDDILSIEGETAETALESLGSGRAYELDTDGFRQLINNNWEVMRQNNLDTVFRVNDIANTDSVYGAIDNIGQIAKNVAENGYLLLENNVAVISNPGLVVKVKLQDIADAFKRTFNQDIEHGLELDNDLLAKEGYDVYGKIVTSNTTRNKVYFAGDNNIRMFSYIRDSGGYPGYGFYNISNVVGHYVSAIDYSTYINTTAQSSLNGRAYVSYNTYGRSPIISVQGVHNFKTETEALNYYSNITVDTVEPIKNPDIVNTEYGNITKDDDISPSINEEQGLDIIPQDEYEPFEEEVDSNYINDDPNILPTYNFINNYINEYTPPVIPTTAPTIPDQPDINPKPTVAPETSDEIMNNRLPGLETKFPFCIPWDFRNALKVFEEEKRAPKITWNLKIERFGIDETLEIDFAIFDPVARILRTLLLITYIVGLILATRQLIRG